jgi:hypothetical protein
MSHLYNSHAGIIVSKKELFTTEPQRSPSKRNGHKGACLSRAARPSDLWVRAVRGSRPSPGAW